MSLQTWLIYLVAAIGLSLSPGPNGLLALTHGVLHGRRRTLYTIFGGAVGFVVVIALSMVGIGALLKASTQALIVMKWLGGTWCGWVSRSGVRRQWAAHCTVMRDRDQAVRCFSRARSRPSPTRKRCCSLPPSCRSSLTPRAACGCSFW